MCTVPLTALCRQGVAAQSAADGVGGGAAADGGRAAGPGPGRPVVSGVHSCEGWIRSCDYVKRRRQTAPRRRWERKKRTEHTPQWGTGNTIHRKQGQKRHKDPDT